MDSEILKKFNPDRKELSPYQLSCEVWTPCLMKKFDRHNEIEINYFPAGEMTYLFHDHKITVPAQKLTVFWGLIPHQIIHFSGESPYYVCTIPFSLFLSWNLPAPFVNQILKGGILAENNACFSNYDEFILQRWTEEIKQPSTIRLVLLEMQARLMRMATLHHSGNEPSTMLKHAATQVEEMAIYIARNYREPLKVSDVSKTVGLHPDYANTLFKKTFRCTINEYITEERIAHAQRQLLTTQTSINQIALESGFNSLSRFNAAFLKINGCTPREYRKYELNVFKQSSSR